MQNIVEKIHAEIDSAEDNLLAEAKRIIEGYSPDQKAVRLLKIGFTGTDTVQEFERKNSVVVKSMEDARLIEYYKQKYPFQKFITEAEFDRICNKYKLVYAPIAAYKKDVPNKNLSEIESAPALQSNDKAANVEKTKVKLHSFGVPNRDFFHFWNLLWWTMPRTFHENIGENWQSIDRHLKTLYPSLKKYEYISQYARVTKINKEGLFIAAPPSHFDKKGLIKNGQYGYMNFTFTEVKDPIVFRYVKGGLQIISKWGLEASDEKVINEIDN